MIHGEPRIAIVHDWLVTYAGAERVLEEMLAVMPNADIFSLVDFVPPDERAFLGGRSVGVSALQRLPFARTRYRLYLPLMPALVEQFDLGGYDLVISSSYCVAKGVLTGPDTLHLCMCYSPVRYAWDLQFQYLRETGRDRGLGGILARGLLHYLRVWDARTAAGVDDFIAISRFISRRILKAYRRDSTVIYPPVDTEAFVPAGTRGTTYVTASRLVPYKRIDVLVAAFAARPDLQLVVIGDGPEMPKLRKLAGSNVQLLGRQPIDQLRLHLQSARAFLFAAEEDFGIAPIEAQACGTPVIAYGRGAARETIRDGITGILFEEQTVPSVLAALAQFERSAETFTAEACRANAERFGRARFRSEFGEFVAARWNAWRATRG